MPEVARWTSSRPTATSIPTPSPSRVADILWERIKKAFALTKEKLSVRQEVVLLSILVAFLAIIVVVTS